MYVLMRKGHKFFYDVNVNLDPGNEFDISQAVCQLDFLTKSRYGSWNYVKVYYCAVNISDGFIFGHFFVQNENRLKFFTTANV